MFKVSSFIPHLLASFALKFIHRHRFIKHAIGADAILTQVPTFD